LQSRLQTFFVADLAEASGCDDRARRVVYVLNGVLPNTAQAFRRHLRPVINARPSCRVGCIRRRHQLARGAALHVDTA